MTISLNVGATSAIFDYASLVSECEDQLDRDDLTAKFPRFVQMVEAYLRRELRVLDMELTTPVIASAEVVDLPDDFLSMRSIYVEGSPDSPLRGMSPAALAHQFNGNPGPVPLAYALIAEQIKLAPPPAAPVELEMVYLAQFTPLTAESVSNWIMDRHPDIYYYGTLAQAFSYISDPANEEKFTGLFLGVVQGLKDARAKDRWGSGPLVPNTVAQVRGARC